MVAQSKSKHLPIHLPFQAWMKRLYGPPIPRRPVDPVDCVPSADGILIPTPGASSSVIRYVEMDSHRGSPTDVRTFLQQSTIRFADDASE